MPTGDGQDYFEDWGMTQKEEKAQMITVKQFWDNYQEAVEKGAETTPELMFHTLMSKLVAEALRRGVSKGDLREAICDVAWEKRHELNWPVEMPTPDGNPAFSAAPLIVGIAALAGPDPGVSGSDTL
jgi:hypothetical protein